MKKGDEEVGLEPDVPEETNISKSSRRNQYIAIIVVAVLAVIFLIALATRNDTSNVSTQTNEQQFVNNKSQTSSLKYLVVDTNQNLCFDNSNEIECPKQPGDFFGQDAQFIGNGPFYIANGDGTVSDSVTELMWQKTPGDKTTYAQAVNEADNFVLAGYDDWRVPTIKELYSLMFFSGIDPDPLSADTSNLVPFIDTRFFDFEYGDTSTGSRIIDSQWVTSTIYQSTVMNNQRCFFGVNFADGRIKCYPTESRQNQGYYARYVRGETYGENDFIDNNNGTITDANTGLLWQKSDSSEGMNWNDSLRYCADLTEGDSSNWRLPNAKELHSIVDYSRSPDSTNSPAISSIFNTTSITNEANQKDWPFFWTSTTHQGQQTTDAAVYIAFGRSMGNMGGWIDVHGAGSQRSDPKDGNPDEYSNGRGPQGDAVRINNYVRCVSDVKLTP